jgi:hypothetical protein
MLGCSGGGAAASSKKLGSSFFSGEAACSDALAASSVGRWNIAGGSAGDVRGLEVADSGGANGLTACAPATAGISNAAAENAERINRFLQPEVSPKPDAPMLPFPFRQ